MVIVVAMAIVVATAMLWYDCFSCFAVECQFSNPFIRPGDTSKDLLQLVDGSKVTYKVSISVARKSKVGGPYVVT